MSEEENLPAQYHPLITPKKKRSGENNGPIYKR